MKPDEMLQISISHANFDLGLPKYLIVLITIVMAFWIVSAFLDVVRSLVNLLNSSLKLRADQALRKWTAQGRAESKEGGE